MSIACDVAIVGAGPYGLATAACVRSRDRLETRVFGETMSFWKRHMPDGMLLRSPWVASHIADPERALTLDDYESAIRKRLSRPLPLEDFVSYGEWFQGAVVPDVDRRSVVRIGALRSGFRLVIDDGEELQAARVVVAGGIPRLPGGRRSFGRSRGNSSRTRRKRPISAGFPGAEWRSWGPGRARSSRRRSSTRAVRRSSC